MTNLEALKAQCKLICNTAYVDTDVAELSLLNEGIGSQDEFVPGDKKIIVAALNLVKGWVETSRSENGISVSTDSHKLEKNIIYWCNKAGVDASDYVESLSVIEDGSNLW